MTKEEYSKKSIRRYTKVLPRGSKQEISESIKEKYTDVDNVWNGKVYKKKIVNAIVRRYNKIQKKRQPLSK